MCDPCQKIIHEFETTVLRTLIGNARIASGMPPRKPRERPKHLPLNREDGTEVPIPADEFPLMVALPRYLPPGSPGPEGKNIAVGTWIFRPTDEELETILKTHGADSISIGSINIDAFARMLAKIGHGFAILAAGINGFDPYLLDFIRTGKGSLNQWVSTHPGNEPRSDKVHRARPLLMPNGEIHVVIQLFAHIGAPTYRVRVGMIKPGEPDKSKSRSQTSR